MLGFKGLQVFRKWECIAQYLRKLSLMNSTHGCVLSLIVEYILNYDISNDPDPLNIVSVVVWNIRVLYKDII